MDIAFPRGDSYEFSFSIRDEETGEVITEPFDAIYFTVKRNYQDKDPVLQLSLSGGSIMADGDGQYSVFFLPSDTEKLRFGTYDADIEVDRYDYCKTFSFKFTMLPETTHYNNK